MKISTKSILLISALTSFVFLIYASYKGVVLYIINKTLEDTFVGGSASDISIVLWFTISGILIMISLMFLFFLKIKDLKSQKIIVMGLTIFWITISIFVTLINYSNFWISLLTLTVGVLSFFAMKNLKETIIAELNKKGLTDKEIYLLQKLAGISKN